MEGKERRRALRKERKEGKGANMKHGREIERGGLSGREVEGRKEDVGEEKKEE